MKRSRWIATTVASSLAGVAILGVILFAGTGSFGVAADTATSTTSSTPFSFAIACTPNPTNTQTMITCVATPAAGASTAGVTYLWNFGDSSAAAVGNPVQHQYTAAGAFPVTATAITPNGNVSAPSIVETVTTALAVQITGPSSGGVGQALTFTASAMSGTALPADTTYMWEFGDGGTAGPSTSNTVTHAFQTSGTFTVRVTATSVSANSSGTNTLSVTIGGTAVSAVTLNISGPTQVAAGTSASYTVSASAGTSGTVPSDLTYSWNFGDSTAAQAGATTSHTWSNPGTYTVTVTATSASTPSANNTTSITVMVGAVQPTGPTVTYAPGWNLVGAPGGTVLSQAGNPLYTFQAGDTNYRTLSNTSPLQNGLGYWAFFNTTTTVSLNGTGNAPATVSNPGNQYVMVGNPSATRSVTVTGADIVYTYNPAVQPPANPYTATTTLLPGQGAWAYCANACTITLQ